MFADAGPAGGAEVSASRLRIVLAEEMIHA
jgi:hypothetical protein